MNTIFPTTEPASNTPSATVGPSVHVLAGSVEQDGSVDGSVDGLSVAGSVAGSVNGSIAGSVVETESNIEHYITLT